MSAYVFRISEFGDSLGSIVSFQASQSYSETIKNKLRDWRDGSVQFLRVLAALLEDQGLIPSTYMAARSHL